MVKNIFLTGRRNIGKSTLIKQVLAGGKKIAGGFYIQEILFKEKRLAFKMVDLYEDKSYKLKLFKEDTIYSSEEPLIARFNGDILIEAFPETFQNYGVKILCKTIRKKPEIVIMDELGRIELPAIKFQQKVFEILDSNLKVIGVLKKESNSFLDKLKTRYDVKVIDMDKCSITEVKKELTLFIN